MAEPPVDFRARERFREEWRRNFAVVANAGSGKTTAISERLAAMALAPEGGELLKKTAVVTFTKKAAAQIGRRAREVLLRRLRERGGDLAPLDALERAFFGTIHSFCLLLAQRHGQSLGLHLDPDVLDAAREDGLWQVFLEQDTMRFFALPPASLAALLRHLPLDEIFPIARELNAATAKKFLEHPPVGGPPEPAAGVLAGIQAVSPKGNGAKNILATQRRALEWAERFAGGSGFLPLFEASGGGQAIEALCADWMAPLENWLASASAVLAAELAERYRAFRFERGVQTYADQIDAAVALLGHAGVLAKIRAEGWRVILDEAQDTDSQQFAVLVEIARPPGAPPGTWPDGGGVPPRPGHFCLVGDGQQAIYGGRADLRNFQKHTGAFAHGAGGEQLVFDVTFRVPRRVGALLNATLPAAFSPERTYNSGLPPAPGAPAPLLQVAFTPLEAGPENADGAFGVLPLVLPAAAPQGVDGWMAEEARQAAAWLAARGPGGVGARSWSEVCVLAPRNDWLLPARDALEDAGLKTALQVRRNRNGDNPPYAWLAGLLAAVCDPADTFERVGVLREIFAVSDAQIAAVLRGKKGFGWENPEDEAEPLRGALKTMARLAGRVDEEGLSLERFAVELAESAGLAGKARAIDLTGAAAAELERLLGRAAELGLEGAGPREWRAELLREIDADRPAGRAADDAVNLLTVHSAKGLEWPVVVVLGLWRGIGHKAPHGLQLLPAAGGVRVFFNQASLPEDMAEARNRERLRENTRLLYVALTRARRTLLLPWAAGFGGRQNASLAEIWGADFAALPQFEISAGPEHAVKTSEFSAPEESVDFAAGPASKIPALPERVLPHRLASAPDAVRTARHESALDEPVRPDAGDEAISYGLWWHETMEFWPWDGGDAERAAHVARALAAADAQGFAARGAAELGKFCAGELCAELGEARWTRLAELGVFAPLRADAWIDGVIDLVAHDAVARRVLVVDWKTNHRRADESDSALLARLAAEYAPQLEAYGACVRGFFPDCAVELRVFASAAGIWRAVGN